MFSLIAQKSHLLSMQKLCSKPQLYGIIDTQNSGAVVILLTAVSFSGNVSSSHWHFMPM